MIALWVLLAILALFLFLLFVPIHIVFQYRERAIVTAKILFFRFDAMKLFRYLSRDRAGKEQSENSHPSPKQKEKNANLNKKVDPLGFVEFLLRIARVIVLALKEHLKRMKINLKELYVSIGTDDAAKTALIYGGAIQAANALCVLLQRFSCFRCDNRYLVISPDFTCEKSRFSIHLDLTVRLFFVIGVLLRAYFRLFERKEMNNERNSVETSH